MFPFDINRIVAAQVQFRRAMFTVMTTRITFNIWVYIYNDNIVATGRSPVCPQLITSYTSEGIVNTVNGYTSHDYDILPL